MIGKFFVGAAGVVISIALAASAGADPVTTIGANPVPQPQTPQDFLAAARAAGITGTDPAMLEDGYNVCWNCGISTPRVLGWPRAWSGTIHS